MASWPPRSRPAERPLHPPRHPLRRAVRPLGSVGVAGGVDGRAGTRQVQQPASARDLPAGAQHPRGRRAGAGRASTCTTAVSRSPGPRRRPPAPAAGRWRGRHAAETIRGRAAATGPRRPARRAQAARAVVRVLVPGRAPSTARSTTPGGTGPGTQMPTPSAPRSAHSSSNATCQASCGVHATRSRERDTGAVCLRQGVAVADQAANGR